MALHWSAPLLLQQGSSTLEASDSKRGDPQPSEKHDEQEGTHFEQMLLFNVKKEYLFKTIN